MKRIIIKQEGQKKLEKVGKSYVVGANGTTFGITPVLALAERWFEEN